MYHQEKLSNFAYCSLNINEIHAIGFCYVLAGDGLI